MSPSARNHAASAAKLEDSWPRLYARDPGDGSETGEIAGTNIAQSDAVERAVAPGEHAIFCHPLVVEAIGNEVEHHDNVARLRGGVQRRVEAARRCCSAVKLLPEQNQHDYQHASDDFAHVGSEQRSERGVVLCELPVAHGLLFLAGIEHQTPAIDGTPLDWQQQPAVHANGDDAYQQATGDDDVGAVVLGGTEDHLPQAAGGANQLGGDQCPPTEAETRTKARQNIG